MIAGDDWHTALFEEERARRELLQQQNVGEACRRWWAAVETVLRLYERSVYGYENYTPPPQELISILKSLAGYLAVGSIPQPIEDARKEGSHKPGPTERLDIAIAVLYVAAAKEGISRGGSILKINDASPIKTVADAYKVEKRTVQKWANKYGVELFIPDPFDSTTLKELLLIAGERYQKAGRSRAAIALRAAK